MQSNDECSVKAELFELVDAEKTRKWKSNFSVERKSGVRDGSMEAVLRTLSIYIAQVGRGTALRGRRTNYSIIVWPPAAHMTVIFSLLCAATAAYLYTLCRRLDRIDELHSTVYNSALSLW